jgi:hypothetical protein
MIALLVREFDHEADGSDAVGACSCRVRRLPLLSIIM